MFEYGTEELGFGAWLNLAVIAKWLVHDEPAEISPSAFDALLSVELKTVAVEEWPGGKAGMGGDSGDSKRAHRRLDVLVEPGGNTATGERGMSEKKVEVASVGVGSKARE